MRKIVRNGSGMLEDACGRVLVKSVSQVLCAVRGMRLEAIVNLSELVGPGVAQKCVCFVLWLDGYLYANINQ